MNDYDAFLKKCFAHHRVAELLIRGSLPDLAADLEFSTLTRLTAEFFGKGNIRRLPDMVWRVRHRTEPLDLIVLIEFQGQAEALMALRTVQYASLALKQLIESAARRKDPARRIAVESLVLYHGPGRWRAPTKAAELVGGTGLQRYGVVMPWASGPGERGKPEEAEEVDVPRLLLGLAREWTAKEMAVQLAALMRLAARFGDAGFDSFVAGRVRESLDFREYAEDIFRETEFLQGGWAMDMVVATFQRSLREMIQEGVQEGLEQGLERGMQQGLGQSRRILCQQATRRFGRAAAAELEGLIARAVPEQIDEVANLVLDCDRADDFLAQVRIVAYAGGESSASAESRARS